MTRHPSLAAGAREQRTYVAAEQRRYRRAWVQWLRYTDAMVALGLHPLSGAEISDRFRELERMERDAG
jgi:hypothetical protein